jgi:hypothetical protein
MYEEDENIKTFTLSEARGLIPRLRKLLARVNVARQALINMREEIDAAREKSELNGGSLFGPAYLNHLSIFTDEIQKIHAIGVQIKDFQEGLVDFPYEYDGRIVYLCWKIDEDEIDWWHEVDAGFAGRQSLTDKFR